MSSRKRAHLYSTLIYKAGRGQRRYFSLIASCALPAPVISTFSSAWTHSSIRAESLFYCKSEGEKDSALSDGQRTFQLAIVGLEERINDFEQQKENVQPSPIINDIENLPARVGRYPSMLDEDFNSGDTHFTQDH